MHTIRLLGGATLDGPRTIGVRGAGQRVRLALLAMLAISRGRPIGRDRLMAVLWPEAETEKARHSLREAVYRLRELLGDEAIRSVGDSLHLDPEVIDCDVWRFEDACARHDWTEADRLYTGPFADGLFVNGTSEFDHWASFERHRLARMHDEVLESLAGEFAAREDWPAAARQWARRVDSDPLDSRVVLRLMQALEMTGDRAEALRRATNHCESLRSELGAAPDPAVTELAELLRRQPNHRRFGRRQTPGSQADGPLAAAGPEAYPTSEVGVAPTAGRFLSRRRIALAAAALLGTALTTTALLQATAPIDQNLIAILPFRTSGADSTVAILGDGLVELLSAEFGGSAGARAVDAGEVLRASRVNGMMGDDGAAPITAKDARRISQRLGAGLVAYGAIVGNPDDIVVTASVLNVLDGSTAVEPVQVRGSVSTLPQLVADLSSRLLAGTAGPWRLTGSDPRRAAPAALMAYLQGMTHYRRGNWIDATMRFLEAFEADSSLVDAGYRFALVHASVAPFSDLDGLGVERAQRAYRAMWPKRGRLRGDHRLLLEAIADTNGLLWQQQALPKLDRAARLLPQSVEAWDLLGAAYYRAGALVGHDDWRARSRGAFLRATQLDTSLAVNARKHLADLAFLQNDARGHLRHAGVRSGLRAAPYRKYQAALLVGDSAAIRAARVEYSQAWARGEVEGIDWAFRGLTLPRPELESLLSQLRSDAVSDEQHRQLSAWSANAAIFSGRPRALDAIMSRRYGSDTAGRHLQMLRYAVGDSASAEWLAQLVLPALPPVPADTAWLRRFGVMACNVALSRIRRGDTSHAGAIARALPRLPDDIPVAEALATVPRGWTGRSMICGHVLRGILASRGTSGRERLLRSDSVMRYTPLNYADYWNYDIALEFARRGEYAMAAQTVRRHFFDHLPLPRLPLLLRAEGRWAALAGDTSTAIAAYRHYLVWRDDPEPELIAERDSVRAELAAMERQVRSLRAMARDGGERARVDYSRNR